MAVSRTAQYVAMYRALENLEPQPLFRDRFAATFLPRDLLRLLAAARVRPLRALLLRYADVRAPGARTSAIARTCFIDDVVRNRVAAGIRQVVILGAGFDCRAHRLPELATSTVFEVDRPETQTWKRARLARAAFEPVRSDVHYVEADFLLDPVSNRLAEAGWRIDQPTLFL